MVPAKAADVEIERKVEQLEVVGNSSENLRKDCDLPKSVLKLIQLIAFNLCRSNLKAEVVIKLDGVEDAEDGCRGGAADEEDDDGDEHQHQHPLLRALQGLHPPPPRPRPE